MIDSGSHRGKLQPHADVVVEAGNLPVILPALRAAYKQISDIRQRLPADLDLILLRVLPPFLEFRKFLCLFTVNGVNHADLFVRVEKDDLGAIVELGVEFAVTDATRVRSFFEPGVIGSGQAKYSRSMGMFWK